MDGLTTHALTLELHDLLAGSFVDRISMPDRHTVTLSLFAPQKGRHNLTIRANPSKPTLDLSVHASSQALNPPPSFTMFLRKYLRRACLDEVSAPPWERVFIFHFTAVDDLGDKRALKLIFECMPRTSNIILLNRQDTILGALRHIDHTINRVREILPAHPYEPPPPQNRRIPDACADSSADELFSHLPANVSTGRAVSQIVAGFSPIVGDEIAYRADLDPRLPFSALDEAERNRLAAELRTVCRTLADGVFVPAIYYDGPADDRNRQAIAVHVVSLSHLPFSVPYKNLYQAVSDYNFAILARDQFERRKSSISKRIQAHLSHTQKKRLLHENDLAEGKQAENDRLMGELILANVYAIPPRSEGVLLSNYYEEGANVYCPLNPQLSPAENAEGYFRRAKRNRRKLEAAARLLANDLDELRWLTSLAAAANYAESEEDLLAIELEYGDRGRRRGRKSDDSKSSAVYHPGKPGAKSRRKDKAFAKPQKRKNKQPSNNETLPLSPRRFLSGDGFPILVGKNNLQNDRLLRKAAKDDIWMHLKGAPGSHVIISAEGRQVPNSTVEEAAGVAAWYSSAGRSGSAVEIDYCPVRNVKKIPQTRPGNVSYQNHKTIYVAPLDPHALKVTKQSDAE
ncbi:MAG TPA: NFACT RNA binding domain-containing protein [Clostridia bacterium]|nr:NFACT RNA binding domain-containing protein [Clostridia bacterium]